MLRKLIFVLAATAFAFAACGRQVTPDLPGTGGASGLPPGFMQVKFTVAGQMDYANVSYVLVFNTSGSGTMPYANAGQTNFANYSFEIVVGGNGTVAGPALIQYVRQPGITLPVPRQFTYSPQQLQFDPNSDGLGDQFTITFDRRLFNGPIVPTPSPGPNGNNTWYVNWFTATPGGGPGLVGQVLDAPGLLGPADTSFTFPPLNVTTSFDQQWVAAAGWLQVSNANAQIAGGEVINSP